MCLHLPIDHMPTYNCGLYAVFAYLFWLDFEQILAQDNGVSQFANGERAFLVFFAASVGRAKGIAPQSLYEWQGLFWEPSGPFGGGGVVVLDGCAGEARWSGELHRRGRSK